MSFVLNSKYTLRQKLDHFTLYFKQIICDFKMVYGVNIIDNIIKMAK
jgi:hypothetical protein